MGVIFTSKASVVWPAEWAAALTCVHVTGSPSSVVGCSTTAEQLSPRDPALVQWVSFGSSAEVQYEQSHSNNYYCSELAAHKRRESNIPWLGRKRLSTELIGEVGNVGGVRCLSLLQASAAKN